jgi:predicted tellurium resistance membrane protein TerC
MWQRVQTLYLLLTIILQWIGLFLPIGSYKDAERLGQCFSLVFDLATTESIIFSVLITVLAVTAITKFKQRKNQMKLCFFLTLVIIAAYITMLVSVYRFAIEQPIMPHFYYAFSLLPVILVALTIMAKHAIRKDDELVRSSNRLR